ncbi:hypothetical protein DPMN_043572 [Dreissena polymorpha]|uniref:Uncharacterized protein n=1 Tax=Dreissena polymorpha TaxID=45954 RepID=A0A9D4D0Q0_DREPO|nr:hypothetical protein DPMN_043572 [Dreissena polymorpha]
MPFRCLLQSVGSVGPIMPLFTIVSLNWPSVWQRNSPDLLSGLCPWRLAACSCSSSPLKRLPPFSQGGLSIILESQDLTEL